jgi:hypothetical protein
VKLDFLTGNLYSVTAAKDALGDKIDESAHNGKAEAHKEYAKA